MDFVGGIIQENLVKTKEAKMKDLLKQAGLTQSEFAKRLGITQSLVSQWISNKCQPQLNMVPKVAKLLNVSVEDILALYK